jgi:carnitine-CoA ligase
VRLIDLVVDALSVAQCANFGSRVKMSVSEADWVVGKVLARQAQLRPEATFVETTDGVRATFAHFDRRANQVACLLGQLGVGYGDRVVVILENGLEILESWFGINRLGAVFVPVNPAYRGDFLRHVVLDSGARVAIVAVDPLRSLEEIEAEIPSLEAVVIVGEGIAPEAERFQVLSYSAVGQADATDIGIDVKVSDPSMILYTSGTTGPSKGVVLPHGSGYMNATSYIRQLGLSGSDRAYCCLPLFHANALDLQIYSSLILGCPVLIAKSFSARAWMADIRRFSATVTNLLGVMTDFVYQQPERADDAENSLRVASSVPIPPAIGASFEGRFEVKLVECYGTTETKMSHSLSAGEPYRPGSCGRLVEEFFECRLVEPESEAEVEVGEPGEMLLRPRVPWTVLLGYHGRPAASESAWRNLWFHTGDLMRCDVDGYYYFIDRIKDCIRRRGENISSYEVERALLDHPDILEAAVFGVPSPIVQGDQEVMAVIVPRDGVFLDMGGVEAFCDMKLPYFAVPRFYEAAQFLPKTPSQKIRKDALKQAGIGPATWRSERASWGRRKFAARARQD